MAKLLFKLHQVPQDEAEEIRCLLETNQLDYYQTASGLFGLSAPAIWLADETQFDQAQALIKHYQEQRLHQAKLSQRDFDYWQAFRRSPFRFLLGLIAVLTLIFFSTLPFFPVW